MVGQNPKYQAEKKESWSTRLMVTILYFWFYLTDQIAHIITGFELHIDSIYLLAELCLSFTGKQAHFLQIQTN